MTGGSGLAPVYGVACCLVVAAALGWPFVAGVVVVGGPLLGWMHARRRT